MGSLPSSSKESMTSENVDQTFKGDINSDGIIDFYDLQEARNIYSNGFKTLSQFCAADIDDNKIIDSDDVPALLKGKKLAR